MRTNRTTLAAVLLTTLVVVPATAVAQSADEESAPVSHLTCTNTDGPSFTPGELEMGRFDWGYRSTVGRTFTADASDPRASGDIAAALVYDSTGDNEMSRGTAIARLVNEGGSWLGPVYWMYYPDRSEFFMAMMDGQDGYDGLTLTMTRVISPTGEEHCQGLIWEGDPPALLDTGSLPDGV